MRTELLRHILTIQLLVVHGLGLLNAVHAALKVRTPQAALGWALALVTFPYFAVPLYWTFGRTKFIGYRRAGADVSGPLHAAAQEAAAQIKPFATDFGAADVLGRWRKLLNTLPATRGNHIELLVDGDATFDAIFAAIDSARDYLLVQFYIVQDDALGMKFQGRLIERAGAGVKVYFLYDEVGCHRLSRKWLRELRESGVRVEGFKTTRGWGNRFQLNFRNHRKLVIVDGREALTGGLNVGDEYLGRSQRFGPWRDTHVRVRGPAVQAAQLAFVEDWNWATDQVPEVSWTPTRADADQRVLVLATGPADETERCSLSFIRAVNSASSRLWISSPYFVPDATVLTALQLAALRGVEVRVLLPARTDHLLPLLSKFQDGSLSFLVINKNPTYDLPASLTFPGFTPGSAAAPYWTYGKPNDLASGGLTSGSAAVSGTGLSYTFPSYSMTVIEVKSQFEAWREANFTPAELKNWALSGDHGQPAGDGVSNLLKYALNLPANSTAAGAALPVIGSTTLSGSSYLTISFTEQNSLTDITYTVQASSDLVNWTTGPYRIDNGSTPFATYCDTVPLGKAPARFLRLMVTRN